MIGCPAPYQEAVRAKLEARGIESDQNHPVVLVSVDSTERWAALEEHAADDVTVAIAVIPDLDIDAYISAFVAGAAAVVYADTSSDVTADVVQAAIRGEVLLPRQAVHSMAVMAKRLRPSVDLDEREVELLRAIAEGQTIVDLARNNYYSERTMRRHLQSLYLKLGVQNRSEAIGAASRMGIVD